MKLNWIKPGTVVTNGLEEAQLEVEWIPGIPVSAVFGSQSPATPEDSEERAWLLQASYGAVEEIVKDVNTRRALFYNEYPSELKVNCISMFHFTVRDEKLDLYVYARSTNLTRLGFDLITVDLVYMEALTRLRDLFKTSGIGMGKIVVHLHSLHYYTEASNARVV